MFYYDVCLNHNGIELRTADSLAPRYAASYAQLIKTLFSSHAAQEGILRRYAGANSAQIEAAKVGICCNGYQAQVYGRAAAGEVSWLLAQAKSHAAAPDDRRLLEPLAELAAKSAPRARFPAAFKPYFPSVPPCIKPSFCGILTQSSKSGVSAMRETSYHVVITEMTVRALWETQNVLDCIPDALWDIRFGGRPSGSIFTICCMSWISGSLTPMTLILWNRPCTTHICRIYPFTPQPTWTAARLMTTFIPLRPSFHCI